MAAFRYLSDERIREVYSTSLALGLASGDTLETLVSGLDETFIASLPVRPRKDEQLLSTLIRLNQVARLADGDTVPLAFWLSNAVMLKATEPLSAVLKGALDQVENGTPHSQTRPITVPSAAVLAAPATPTPVAANPATTARLTAPLPEEAILPDDQAVQRMSIRTLSGALDQAYLHKMELRQGGLDTSRVDATLAKMTQRLMSGAELRVGSTIGNDRFEVLKRIGQEGHTVSWKALDRERGQMVALQVLDVRHANNERERESFFGGAARLAQLNHPNVLRVLVPRATEEFNAAVALHYYVIELLTGGKLKTAVLERRLGREAALRAVLQIGGALQHAHGRKITNWRVSPDTIVLDERGAPRLFNPDLTWARETATGTTEGMAQLIYAAPEALIATSDVDPRTDLYSLGMTALFACRGKLLSMDVLADRAGFFARLDAPEAVKRVIDKATRNEVGERYSDIAEFGDALDKAMSGASEPQPAPVKPAATDGGGGLWASLKKRLRG